MPQPGHYSNQCLKEPRPQLLGRPRCISLFLRHGVNLHVRVLCGLHSETHTGFRRGGVGWRTHAGVRLGHIRHIKGSASLSLNHCSFPQATSHTDKPTPSVTVPTRLGFIPQLVPLNPTLTYHQGHLTTTCYEERQ